MAANSHNDQDSAEIASFVTASHYVIGAGETVQELQMNGKWLRTDDPVDVRR
ncbi:MAG: hypothetical protein V5A39_14075 [Haloarculaceae archaeon]